MMQCKDVQQNGKILQMKVTSSNTVTTQNQNRNQNYYYEQSDGAGGSNIVTETSENFVMSGVVTVQIKNYLYKKGSSLKNHIFIELNKKYQSDSLTYKVTVNSDMLKVDGMEIIVSECDKYCIQIKDLTAFVREFDITFILDIFNDRNLFCDLYEDTDYADFEIHGENGSIMMHKLVLLSHSPVLKSMLNGPWKEAKAGALEVPKITKENLQQLKDYMYLQKLPESGVEQLAALASYYMIRDLKLRCAVKLLGMLSAQNASELLEFAVKYNIKLLMLGILDSVKRGAISIEDIDRCCTDE